MVGCIKTFTLNVIKKGLRSVSSNLLTVEDVEDSQPNHGVIEMMLNKTLRVFYSHLITNQCSLYKYLNEPFIVVVALALTLDTIAVIYMRIVNRLTIHRLSKVSANQTRRYIKQESTNKGITYSQGRRISEQLRQNAIQLHLNDHFHFFNNNSQYFLSKL